MLHGGAVPVTTSRWGPSNFQTTRDRRRDETIDRVSKNNARVENCERSLALHFSSAPLRRLYHFLSFPFAGCDMIESDALPNGLIPPTRPLVGESPPPPSAFIKRFSSELVKFGDVGNPPAAATAFAYAFVGISSARRGSGSDAATATAAMIGSEFSMARVMSRTAVLGTCLLGALSGFGAVHFPYTTIRVFHRAVPDAEVSSLERRLVQSVETIVERKKEIETLKREMARETRERGAKSGGGVLGRIASGFRLPVFQEGRAKRIIDINAEVDALEMVNRTLFADLHDINLLKERKRLAKTAYGRLLEACGVVMAVICGYRFVAGLKRLLFMQTPKSDPISFALHLFLANKSIHVDPEVLAQYLSLLLIAFLVINSMQNFILQLVKLFFAFGGGVTTDALVLFTTEMVGLYFISSVLLIREQLPERYRQSVTDALGADLEFRFYAKFYELIFMASAALTAFALYAKNVTASTPDDVTASASVSSLLAAEKKTNAAPLLPRSSKHP